MPLTRISKQGNETLEKYFNALYDVDDQLLSHKQGYINWVDNILFVIHSLSDVFKETTIWALTSIHKLVLLNDDNWERPWLITISCDECIIYIEVLRMHNKTIEVKKEDFLKQILVIMSETEEWQNNSDIEQYFLNR